MRSIPEIDSEFKNVCMQLGHTYAQKMLISTKVKLYLKRLDELETEAAARRLVDEEKAKEEAANKEPEPAV